MKRRASSLALTSSGLFLSRSSNRSVLLFARSTSPFSSVRSYAHDNNEKSVRRALDQSDLPNNTIINFVPQQQAWVVERFGKFLQVLDPGLRILLPVIDRIAYVHTLKAITLEITHQQAITRDNVSIEMDGILYYQVIDPVKASYNVENAENAIQQLAMSTLRVEAGKLTLDKTFEEREQINANVVAAINGAVGAWGLTCLRYEIRDIRLPERAMEAMELQMVAERRRRQRVIRSEGIRTAAINKAEGRKQALTLKAEGLRLQKALIAEGEAKAIEIKAIATAKAISKIAKAIGTKKGHEAVALSVAEKYVEAFSNIAKEGNTVLLPTNTGDVGSMVAQALTIFDSITKKKNASATSTQQSHEEETEQEHEEETEESDGEQEGETVPEEWRTHTHDALAEFQRYKEGGH